jgi:hypothetical protein
MERFPPNQGEIVPATACSCHRLFENFGNLPGGKVK